MKLIISIILAFNITAYAHSGGTDANGCHHDRKNGGYHCHNGRSATKKTNISNVTKQSRAINSENKEETVTFNTKSKKYHSHNCKSAKACTVNCVTVTKDEAMHRGGMPCGNCGG